MGEEIMEYEGFFEVRNFRFGSYRKYCDGACLFSDTVDDSENRDSLEGRCDRLTVGWALASDVLCKAWPEAVSLSRNMCPSIIWWIGVG